MISNLRLDPETGWLFWTGAHRTGKQAGTIDRYGYRSVRIGGKAFLAHRVVWFLHHGKWPDMQIDHVNGVLDDNRPCNLRLVSCSEQSKNKSKPSVNTSGRIGVTWHKGAGKWQAGICVSGKHIHLGIFSDFDEACASRAAGEIEYGFHPNHGRARP